MIRWVRERHKFILIALFAVLAISYVLFTESGLYKLYRLQQEKDRLDQEISSLRENNHRLTEQARLLRDDQETIERAIQEKLRMVQPDDTIFIFENESADAGGSSSF